jgi:hypothetical protein
MSFFSKISVEKVIGNLLRRNVYDYPAFQVVEVKPEDYVHYQTIAREDSLVFYGNQETNQYEIVLFKELQSKTAFRSLSIFYLNYCQKYWFFNL